MSIFSCLLTFSFMVSVFSLMIMSDCLCILSCISNCDCISTCLELPPAWRLVYLLLAATWRLLGGFLAPWLLGYLSTWRSSTRLVQPRSASTRSASNRLVQTRSALFSLDSFGKKIWAVNTAMNTLMCTAMGETMYTAAVDAFKERESLVRS